jgi:hypothetical protein
VVERTLGWFGRNRRLAKDFETTIASSEAWLYLASVQLLARRLARAPTTNRHIAKKGTTFPILGQTLRVGKRKASSDYRAQYSVGTEIG